MRDATFFANCKNSVEKSSARKLTREEREQTIRWLQAHNYPALPVAPVQDAIKYHKEVQANTEKGVWQHCPLTADLQPIGLYTGKNPSYLDKDGVPHLVNHRQYQDWLPSEKELETWFAHPANGVGTLGGRNNTAWLDFDVKHLLHAIKVMAQLPRFLPPTVTAMVMEEKNPLLGQEAVAVTATSHQIGEIRS